MLIALGILILFVIIIFESGTTPSNTRKKSKVKDVEFRDLTTTPERAPKRPNPLSQNPAETARDKAERKRAPTELHRSAPERQDNERAISLGRQTVLASAQSKEIYRLFHFTRFENVESILESGLRTREELENAGSEAAFNDSLRLDNRRNSISLSISFPNHLMLSRLKREMPNSQWVVLELPSSILWGYKCAFFRHNAADKRMRTLPLSDLLGVNALESMFLDSDMASLKRANHSLLECDPTDSQAEVLILENLPASRIIHFIFEDKRTLAKFQQNHSASSALLDASLFATRESTRKWQFAQSTSRSVRATGPR